MKLQAFALLLAGIAIFPAAARAALIVTYAESPGQQFTSVTGASTMTFDATTLGWNSALAFNPGGTTLGTYDQIRINSTDQYGGANNTRYATVSGFTSTLSLTARIGYFGMWWSAGDPQNVLEFYDSSTLVARFTTANLLSTLPNEYRGNPTPGFLGQNSSESYAYLNFFGYEGTKWDKVLITNGGSSGFESDNHSVCEAEWNFATEGALPGVVFERISGTTSESITAEEIAQTPEPGSFVLFGAGAALLALARKLR